MFTKDNRPDINEWHWLDMKRMAMIADTLPIVLDACRTNDKEYPIGGQVITEVSDNHLAYSITWFSIAIVGLVMGNMRMKGTKVVRQIGTRAASR